MRKGVTLGLILSFLIFAPPSSSGVEYVQISGIVQYQSPTFGSAEIKFWLKGQAGNTPVAGAQVSVTPAIGTGKYSVLVPKNTPLDIALMSNSDGFAGYNRII